VVATRGVSLVSLEWWDHKVSQALKVQKAILVPKDRKVNLVVLVANRALKESLVHRAFKANKANKARKAKQDCKDQLAQLAHRALPVPQVPQVLPERLEILVHREIQDHRGQPVLLEEAPTQKMVMALRVSQRLQPMASE
jgi:hypothetical protein